MTSRAVLTVLTLLAAPAAWALEVPYLAGRVNDTAALLSPEARERIESKLAALERETGSQVAVLTVPSLEGEPLEDYSLRVAETWKLGRRGVDDGVLVLVARDDRQMRIEVGYGLEGALPDAAAKRILSNLMTPRFRAGDFDGGVEAAVDAIAGTVRGEEGLIPEEPPSSGPESLGARFIAFLIFFAVVGAFSLSAASSQGCTAWFLFLFLMPFYFAFPAGILGGEGFGVAAVVLWIVAFPLLRLWLPKTSFGRSFSAGSRSSGGGWSSSGGGWSSSGGGFSGGGGSFGGGGASGSW